MTTLEHASHAVRRKGYAPHYTMANLALFQPQIHDFTMELINVCTRLFCIIMTEQLMVVTV